MSTKNECCPDCYAWKTSENLVGPYCKSASCPCHKPTESWEELEKVAVGMCWSEYEVGIIKKLLHSQREELCGRLEGLRKNESNRNGTAIAYLGYNHALDDAIKAIKSSTKNLSGNLAEEIIDEIIEETIVQAIKNND